MDRITKSGHVIKGMEITCSNFINTSTIIYGPSRSGKSIMGVHIMCVIAALVSMFHVVSPMESSSNQVFKGFVPSIAIRKDSDPEKIYAFMQAIWDRQQMAVAVYTKAMNLTILAQLYKYIQTSESNQELTRLNEFFKQAFEKADRFKDSNPQLYETEKDKLVEQKEKLFIGFFRKHIGPHRNSLSENDQMSPDQLNTLRYLYFNPNVCVVLDDCAAQLIKIQKKPLFMDYLYKGRHAKITLIITAQDDTDIASNLRKNAFQSIFCTSPVSRSFFSRPSNSFSRDDQRNVDQIVEAVFTGRPDDYGRLIWQRTALDQFQVITAKKMTQTPLGSSTFWAYCKKVGKKSLEVDRSNEFYDQFH